MRFLILISLIFYVINFSGCAVASSTNQAEKLKHYQFEEVESLIANEARPVVVFLEASWCEYCKNMKQTTFKNGDVISLLNQYYYFVRFDGEQKEPISFRNNVYGFNPKGRKSGTHELAIALNGSSEVIYPSIFILNSSSEVIFQKNSFVSSFEMKTLLNNIIPTN